MRNMMHLKVTNFRGSRKIFSMCKTEYAEGSAKLHPPSQDRVKGSSNGVLGYFSQKLFHGGSILACLFFLILGTIRVEKYPSPFFD